MADRYHSDTQEKIEVISYAPGTQDSTDLEAGTNTITATAEATGVGNADYSAALTLPAPSDGRLEVMVVGARLSCTIDSMTAGDLYCRVYVDQQDADHRLFDLDWTTNGNKLSFSQTYSAAYPAIFNLLKDGGAHTFYFFFWVDTGNAVISLVQLWEGVGSSNGRVLMLDFTGLVWANVNPGQQGTGSPRVTFWNALTEDHPDAQYAQDIWRVTVKDVPHQNPPMALIEKGAWEAYSTVGTDLVTVNRVLIVLRSHQ